MSITKKALAEKIKRRFGHPMVKVELDNSQIYDGIDKGRKLFLKWAVGQATHEVYFTMMLSAGQNFYDMPIGVTEVVNFDMPGTSSGINTLFTLDNYLYNNGYYDWIWGSGAFGYTLINYHIARDFLQTVRKYTPSMYNWKYHPYTNQVEVHPAPPSGNALTLSDGTHDSPGFVLARAYMIEGSSYGSAVWQYGDSDEDFFNEDWVEDYAVAYCKEILGRIRSKFAQFASIGNQGIALDGDQLLQESQQEMERLKEELKLEEVFDGYGIEIGY